VSRSSGSDLAGRRAGDTVRDTRGGVPGPT
jgi:hypothetical protein